ncbi:MAG TPA: shikimate dehydrogenase, partial [Casimicrobiaceae bacterium]|nr:shikimate dehydrogenase [Casimicrobiaceae bacterium]
AMVRVPEGRAMSSVISIKGATRLYPIIGDPIAQVRSPEVFTDRFAAQGIDAVMVPAHVPADQFDTIVPALMGLRNLDGVLVTVPFKARMVPFAQRLGPAARAIGAVNALRRDADGAWTADMFDGAGFVRGAERKGQRLRERRVAQFGAGGAGSAIACALAEAGVASIALIDPEPGKAEALVAKLRDAFPACKLTIAMALPADADMVVNASPIGMKPQDGMPGDIRALNPDTLVGDVVVLATPTPLIAHAIRCGCAWVDGKDMHAGQVDALLDFLVPGSG